ncbi:MAG TPA: hypothetical protein VFA04_27450 [Bryobacteraceae bacterium]|nr:hypothetical protein [Bryobacteraceae bacterium]
MESDPLRPGWNKPLPERLAGPTYWPAALAFGMNLALLGPVTSMWLTLVGFVVGGFAIAGWVGDIFHER